MKHLKTSSLLSTFILLVCLFFFNSCKKEKTTEIYFTTLEGSTERGGGDISVVVEISEPMDKNVEITFESVGPDVFRLGTINQIFFHDDSSKCSVEIDNAAFIDTMGHVKLSMGEKRFKIIFTPLYDNFPHAAVEFKLKMVAATNAVILQGRDVFTFRISDAPADNLFTSAINYSGWEHDSWIYDDTTFTDTMLLKSGAFTLSSTSFVKNNSGTYDLTANYTFASGTSKIPALHIQYSGFQKPADVSDSLICGNSGVEITFLPPDVFGVPGFVDETLSCSDLTTAVTHLNLTPKSSSVYGAYYQFTGNINLQQGSAYSFQGNLNSEFVLF